MKQKNINVGNINERVYNSPQFSLKNISKEILKTKDDKKSNVLSHSYSPNPQPSKKITPFLYKDKINFSPGYGLWCLNLGENNKYENNKEISDLIHTALNTAKDLEENVEKSIEQKTIEHLRFQVTQYVVKLEQALGNFYEAEFRAKRAEDLKSDYLEITEKKVKEVKELSELNKSFEEEIINLKEALTNSKLEINRLNNELKIEREKNDKLYLSHQNFIKEKENKEEKMNNEKKNYISQIQQMNNQIADIKKNNKYLKYENPEKPLIQNKLEDDSQNKNKIIYDRPQYNRDSNENVLKYQLEIIDLKNKVADDELQKSKLLEILKKKKEKNKSYKEDITKLILLFEDSNREVKWKQSTVLHKNNMIKALKNKIEKQDSEGKKLLKYIAKLKVVKPTSEYGIEVNDDILFPVRANPKLFEMLK